MKEPKLSEIEKLLKHFRETGREDEVVEIIEKHGIKNSDPTLAIDPDTHEINPETIMIEKIERQEGLLSKSKRFLGGIKFAYKEKWYVRYGTYYVILFFLFFTILNAPIIINNFKSNDELIEKPQVISYQTIEQQKNEKSAPLDIGEVVPASPTLVVPKIGITAPIIFLDSRDEKLIQNTLTQGVVHYSGTAKPGEVGNTFITGHSSNFWWIRGNYNYIFLNLDKMIVGDRAIIYYGGNKYVYEVKDKKVVEASDLSVLAQAENPTLTLMTCTPPGTNWKRLVVILNQIAPTYHKPQVVTKQVLAEPTSLPSTDSNSFGAILNKISQWFLSIFKLD